MGFRELNNFSKDLNDAKGIYKIHLIVHTSVPVLSILFMLIASKIFDFPIEDRNHFTSFIMLGIVLYTIGAIFFGVCAFLSIFLGALTNKDSYTYYSIAFIWYIIYLIYYMYHFYYCFSSDEGTLTSFFMNKIETCINGASFFFIILLIVSIMNRFNNMNKKIDEMYKDYMSKK
jgi:hypothetical protein